MSYKEKRLGLYIGLHATVDDQYEAPLLKFERAISAFAQHSADLSIAMRILVVNVFLWGLFSFPNRHFLMPLHLVRRVQCAALRFITPVPWVKLGFLCHVSAVYGLRVQLRDLRLANVASIISSCPA